MDIVYSKTIQNIQPHFIAKTESSFIPGLFNELCFISSYDNSQDTISIIATQLNTVKDLNLAMTEIVQMLDMSQSTPENMDQNPGMSQQ